MGLFARNCIVVSAFASLVLFCSCDRHPLGELPEVQKEHILPATSPGAEPGAGHTPAAKPTPADFFPESKP